MASETGANLALRALGWGTLFAFLGTGSLAFAIWKLSGAKDVSGFFNHSVNILIFLLHTLVRRISSKVWIDSTKDSQERESHNSNGIRRPHGSYDIFVN